MLSSSNTNAYNWPADTETAMAHALYRISPYRVPLALIRSVLLVKLSCARCNAKLGHIESAASARLEATIEDLMRLDDSALSRWFSLDAYQGGAGTSINMNVNEAIVQRDRELAPEATPLDIHTQVNLHQSTNDVMPTALHLMMLDSLVALEPLVAGLQTAAQTQEQRHAGTIMTGHTQLQDAVSMDAGRIFATWAGVLQRDRWRIFKARERLKDVNLGGTAIGTGAGAPRRYVLQVIRVLQSLTPHPINRAEDPVEATSNYDGIAEAMSVASVLAQTIRRIANDIRLLSSGPVSGFAIFRLPRLLKGSSIMPGKVNPVMAEAAIQVAERVMANDALIARLCASSELQLNAFFPLISYTVWESLNLLAGICPALSIYIDKLEVDATRAAQQVAEGYGGSLALTPLLGYRTVEALILQAQTAGHSLRHELEQRNIFEPADLDRLFSPKAIQGMGYDEEYYTELRSRSAAAILQLRDELGGH